MSISVARHGAAAFPIFSNAAKRATRQLSASIPARHPRRHDRAFSVKTRAEMEYDYDIFTIGTHPQLVSATYIVLGASRRGAIAPESTGPRARPARASTSLTKISGIRKRATDLTNPL